MKTIDDQVKENYFEFEQQCAFKHGVNFAQRWIPVEEELPIAFESGSWDGLRSEFVIAKCKNDKWYKARIYSGTIDGSEFCEWYSDDDFQISNVVSWRPIEYK